VGDAGTGTLNVASGGLVTAGGLRIGNASTGIGTVNVTGSGSTIDSTSLIYVGNSGTGELNISAGGSVTSTSFVTIGNQSTSTGALTVTGAGSSLIAKSSSGFFQSLDIGSNGDGSLTISAGGSVSVGTVYFGNSTGSSGTGLVTGTDSSLTSGTLYLGNFGTGTTGSLDIEAGASVSAGTVYLGNSSGTSGTLNISGTDIETGMVGSSLTASGTFYVGNSGDGTLTISAGGFIDSGSTFYLGNSSGTMGSAIVTGNGSKITTTNYLYVGNSGDGSIAISDGGSVSAEFDIYIGNSSSSVGIVTVTSTGSILTTKNDLYIGNSGNGTLTISAGGSASADGDIYIAGSLNTTGMATVTGAGSELTTTSTLYLGNFSSGANSILRVSDGGTVSVGIGAFDELRIWERGLLTGNGGTIIGNVFNEGFIEPGNSFGTLTIDGSLTLESTSLLSFELGGLTQGIEYDFIDVSGLVTLGGELEIFILDGFENFISPSDTFEIISGASLTGEFFGLPNGQRFLTADSHAFFDVQYDTNSVFLTNFVIPEPGTYGLLMGLGMLAIVMVRRRMASSP